MKLVSNGTALVLFLVALLVTYDFLITTNNVQVDNEKISLSSNNNKDAKASAAFIVTLEKTKQQKVEEVEEDKVRMEKISLMKRVSDANSNEKFLIYQPSGGLNNQRIILTIALVLSRIFNNRTLLIAPLYKHTSHWTNAYNLNGKSLMRADRVFDFDVISKYLKNIIALRDSLKPTLEKLKNYHSNKQTNLIEDKEEEERSSSEQEEEEENEEEIQKLKNLQPSSGFNANNEDWGILFAQSSDEIHNPTLFKLNELQKLAKEWDGKKFVQFGGAIMWQFHRKKSIPNGLESMINEAESYVRYNEKLRRIAYRVVKSSLTSTYNALHIRRGDFKALYAGEDYIKDTDGYFYNAAVKEKKMNVSLDLYVATEPNSNVELPKLLGAFNQSIKFSKNLIGLEPFNELFDLPKQTALRNDMLGVVEQLIASCSFMFVGTPHSTFTRFIRTMRNNRIFFFPECKRRFWNFGKIQQAVP